MAQKILSIPTDIKQNQGQIEELTVIDELYQKMELVEIKQILDEEEYDSEALAEDILVNDEGASNIAKWMKCPAKYTVMQQYMRQNTRDNKSSPGLMINPSKKLTHQAIRVDVEEKFVDPYVYMKEYMLLHGYEAVKECRDGKHMIIDYNFHRKKHKYLPSLSTGIYGTFALIPTEKESLYVICEKKPKKHKYLPSVSTGIYGAFALIPNEFNWKMRHKLFTKQETEKLCNISTMEIPQPMKMQSFLMQESQQTMKQIENALKNDDKRNKLIKNKHIKWNRPEKVPIFGKKSKSPLSLQLNKEEFVKRLCEFNDNLSRDDNNRVDNITLIPIVKDKHVEIVWIVSIGIDINIGISLKLHQNKMYNEWIIPSGIYLDISDQHKLVPYEQHDCQCLSNFVCIIDDLKIGNDANRTYQRYATLQKKLNIVKQNILRKKSVTAITNDSCLSTMDHIDVPLSDPNFANDKNNQYIGITEPTVFVKSDNQNNGKHQHDFVNEQVFLTNLENKHLALNDNNNEIDVKQSSWNDSDHSQCQCVTLQKQLDDAKKYTKWLESKRKNDIISMQQLKITSTSLNKYIIKLGNINNFYFTQTLNPVPSTIIPHQEHRDTHSINVNILRNTIKH